MNKENIIEDDPILVRDEWYQYYEKCADIMGKINKMLNELEQIKPKERI